MLERTGSYDAMWLIDLELAGLAAAVALSVREEPRSPSPCKVLAPAYRATGISA
jgi:hypothetical protein